MQSDMERIREITHAQSFEDGLEYHHKGCVVLLSITNNMVLARVTGSREYTVSIQTKGAKTNLACTCNYDYDGYCKHIAAVLLGVYYATGNLGMVKQVGQNNESSYSMFSPYIHKDEFNDELGSPDWQYMGKGTYVKKGKKIHVTKILSKTGYAPPLKKCEMILKSIYDKAKNKDGLITDKNKVKFDAVQAIVQDYEDSVMGSDAVSIHMQVCKYISENMSITDDKKLHYTRQFQYFIRHAIPLMRRLDSGSKKKQDRLRYLFEMYVQEDVNNFALMYLDALYETASDVIDLKYCKSLFESQMGRKPVVMANNSRRSKNEILEAFLLLLGKMGDDHTADFLSKHYKSSESLCARYIWNLADNNVEKALKVAQSAAKTFTDTDLFVRMQNFILEQNADPRQIDILTDMFGRTGNWSYYEKIKSISDDWDHTMNTILDRLEKGGCLHTCIDVLLHEGRIDVAIIKILESNDLDMHDAYSNELATLFSKEYYSEYTTHIPSLIQSAKKNDYKDIERHIAVMKQIPGHGDKTRKFLAELVDTYPRFAKHMESAGM